jgi:ribosomal protein S13
MVDHEDLPLPGDTRPDELFTRDHAEILKLRPIHLRNLLKRAFAFGLRNSLSEAGTQGVTADADSPTWSFIKGIKSDSSAFLKKLKEEVWNIARLARQIVTEESLQQITVDVPEHTRIQQGATSIYIKQPATLPRRWALPIDQVAEYYRKRALSYIFAPVEICGVVAVAAEKIIFEAYGLEFEQQGFLSERTAKEALALKSTISKTDYYQATPALKPKSDFLLTAEAQEKITATVKNLAEFRSYRGDRVTPSRVSAFLMQFPEELQSTALDLITLLRVFNPEEIVEAVGKKCRQLKAAGVTKILLAPLGNLTDSAAHLLYYFKNSPILAEAEVPAIAPISDSTVNSADHLIFFDDNINTMLQTINIFAEWLGVPLPLEIDLNEHHVAPLQEEARATLRALPLDFIFGLGTRLAEDSLPKMLHDLCGMTGTITVTICRLLDEDHRPLTGKNSRLRGDRVDLRAFLEKVGAVIVCPGAPNSESVRKRALGDNGTEGLYLLPYNSPSMAITALWCPGTFNGQPWLPLCERRRHRKPNGAIVNESN